MKCYLPHCPNEACDPSGLCAACLRTACEDHMRTNAEAIPATCVEKWDHRPDTYWYWSSRGFWEQSAVDPRYLPDFAGWERPDDVPECKTVEELSRDLAHIIVAQLAVIAQLRADRRLLEQLIMEERAVSNRTIWPN